MKKSFYDALKERRTNYSLSGESPVSDGRIREVLEFCILHAPSAFNSQNARVCLLLGDHHKQLWDIVAESLKKKRSLEAFKKAEEKINSFKSGYGSVLFFEDMNSVEALQQSFPSYQDQFPVWSSQGCAMLQYMVWAALETEGLAANLQHYNPLIDEAVMQEWNLDPTWKLVAQMPFGAPTQEPDAKTFADIEGRFKVFD